MKTGCKEAIECKELSGRKVVSQFNGGQITTDAGGLLLREIEQARKQYTETGRASRVYKDFFYKTVKSWLQSRRVVGKAEY